MRFRTRIGAALTGAGLVLSGLALAAPPAHATTGDCLSALGNQCGTFQGVDATVAAHVIYWDVRGKSQASGAVLIGYSADSSADEATDITKVEHVGKVPGMGLSDQNTISYSFVYTPRGKWTSMCLADLNNGTSGIILRPCNGLQWQRWVAQSAGTGSTATPVAGSSGFNGTFVSNVGTPASPGSGHAFLNAASRKYLSGTGIAGSSHPADSRQLTDTLPSGAAPGTLAVNQVWHWAA